MQQDFIYVQGDDLLVLFSRVFRVLVYDLKGPVLKIPPLPCSEQFDFDVITLLLLSIFWFVLSVFCFCCDSCGPPYHCILSCTR